MKKELILASIMATNVAPVLAAADLSALVDSALIASNLNIGRTFISRDIIRGVSYVKVIKNPDGTSKLLELTADARLMFEFIKPVNNAEFEGKEEDLDFEIRVTYIDAVTGNLLTGTGTFYYAKQISGKTFKIYDCDSSNVCHQDVVDKFYVYPTPEGHALRLEFGATNLQYLLNTENSAIFYEK